MSSWMTIGIFLIIYLFISVQRFPFIKIDRPAGVFTGVTLLILTGVITLTEGYSFIDWDVITFLLGMMIMLAYLKTSGFFELAAYRIVGKCGTPKRLLAGVVLASAVLSALFVNDTVCLLVTPIIIAAVRELRANPMPYLLGVAFSSNIGSALTVTGNPQNMYIGITTGMDFISFSLTAAVPVILSLVFCYFVLAFFYRNDLRAFESVCIEHPAPEYDKPLMIKTLAVLFLTMGMFVAGVSYPLAALIGATVNILIARIKPAIVFTKIDWPILLFFAGLFIVMGAFGKCGYADAIMNLGAGQVSPDNIREMGIFSAVVIVLSNAVSNVPAVILMMPAITETGSSTLPVMLALVSTFAGNLTLVGSVANLIVAERAESEGITLKFTEHLKLGLPVTVFSCIITVLWVYTYN